MAFIFVFGPLIVLLAIFQNTSSCQTEIHSRCRSGFVYQKQADYWVKTKQECEEVKNEQD